MRRKSGASRSLADAEVATHPPADQLWKPPEAGVTDPSGDWIDLYQS